LFLIIFIKNSQYLNLIFIYFEDLNTNIVKYYIKEYNQQVTKDNSKNLYYQVGTSETLRVQKRNVIFNKQLKNTVSFNHNYNNDNEIQFNQ
jgi:lipopolysaccharide export LptBFGC system permease protein LptF